MLRHSTLYQLYLVSFVCVPKSFNISTTLTASKRLVNTRLMHSLFFIVSAFFITTVNANTVKAQELTSEVKVENISADEYFRQAKSFRKSNHQKSFNLAQKSLALSIKTKNNRLSAQAHNLLGKLEKTSKNTEESIKHFLQASILYQDIGDKRNQLMASLNHIKLLVSKKRYKKADKILGELIKVAQQHENKLWLAKVFLSQGTSYEKQKRYKDAIAQYTLALPYLKGKDKVTYKYLSSTHVKLAEGYKYLKVDKQAIEHFSEAALVYKYLGNTRKQLMYSLNQVKILLNNSHYKKADEILKRLMSVAQQHDDKNWLAKVFMRQGNSYEKQSKYNDAVEQYSLALQYFTAKDKDTYKDLASTHHQLARTYQDLKNEMQAIENFSEAAIIYKKLGDKKNQLISSLSHIEILFNNKNYKAGEQILKGLVVIALQYDNQLLLAKVLMSQGYGYEKQKRYNEAISRYSDALKYLTGKNTDTYKDLATTYHQIAQSYKHLKKYAQSTSFYKKSLDAYQSLDDKESIAQTLTNLAIIERYKKNYVSALDYSIRGLAILNKLDKPDAYAQALLIVGRIYRDIGRYEKSLNHMYEAHEYYKQVGDLNNIAETSNQIGLIYTRLKKFDQSRSFFQLTINMSDQKIRPSTTAAALREIAVIDTNNGELESAIEMAQKAYNIYKDIKDKEKISITARIIGNIYHKQRDDSQAIAYYRKAAASAQEASAEAEKIKALNALGKALIARNTNEAIILLKESLLLSLKAEMNEEVLSSYQSLRVAEKSNQNIAASLAYAEKEIDLIQKIHHEREKNELIWATAKLDSHKMEMEIASLREKSKLHELELTKKTSELEIVEQAKIISELQLIKNKYANFALAFLLVICLLVVFFVYRRFIASKKHNKKLDYLATHDQLTNCYNRRYLFDFMERDFSNIEQLDEYAIVMTDIDHFKDVNDTHGHSVGDTVLRGVANILQNNVRKSDIVARFGGEEFCMVFPSADQDHAMKIANKLRKKIAESRFGEIKVTCSFGVSSIKFHAMDPTGLIEQADLALYKSKDKGRNQVTLWDESLKQ